MGTLFIDIETYSGVSLRDCGVYKYAGSPDFEIMLFGWAVDDGPARADETLSSGLKDLLMDPNVTKVAHNAEFEITCLEKYLPGLPLSGWVDTMFLSSTLGLPSGLANAGKCLGIAHEKLSSEGTALVSYFAVPAKPTKANGQRTRNLPSDSPDKWESYKLYNMRDVEAERDLYNALIGLGIPESEFRLWRENLEINRRGVMIDTELAEKAIALESKLASEAEAKLIGLGIANPRSAGQFKEWLESKGDTVNSLEKKEVEAAMGSISPEGQEALGLRAFVASSSTKKYAKMLDVASSDGRARGLFQANGARTGRFTSHHIQLQNMYRCSVGADGLMDAARRVKSLEGDYEDLKNCVRAAIVPSPGCKLVVSDFSQIEARLSAFVAGESWAVEAFEEGRDIYSETASRMAGVPYGDIAPKDAPMHGLRQRGKVASLALGYGGGENALVRMGALEMGIPEEALKGIVSQWRAANPRVASMWKVMGEAALGSVASGERRQAGRYAAFRVHMGFLQMGLVSGRMISYYDPRLEEGPYGPQITFGGSKDGSRTKLWGGMCFENLIQGLARDILVGAMRSLEAEGFKAVATVHDEIITEAPDNLEYSAEKMTGIMCRPPIWAKGLPLSAESWEGMFYRKE